MLPYRADEAAALAFSDLASALDAGLPLHAIGGDPSAGEQALADLCTKRGVRLRPTERIALEAGWRSGNAAECLRKRAAARRRSAAFQSAAVGALAYPALLFFLLLLASLATMAVVGPTLSIILACVYGGVVAGVVLIARRLGRGDSALERYPLIGKVLLQLRELPYLEALHALYGAGLPIVDAHRTALATVRLQGLREQLTVAQEMLEQGRPLQEALETSASLSLETRALLATGEQAGELEDALERALVRRTEMAELQLQRAARAAGTIAYVSAAIGVVVIAVQFYTSYYGPLFAMLR